MYCIGLTGTTASGKSTVANHFATLGIDVISADEIAKKLPLKNKPAFHDIRESSLFQITILLGARYI